MSAVYDSWDRLVDAVLSREDLRRSGMRTPSEMSSLSARSSFSLISLYDYSVNSPLFTYDQILRATDRLSSSRLVFFGVSGDFYSGVWEEGGVPVLVKKVYPEKLSFLKSEMDFFAKVSHPNFVPLVGYCLENQDLKFVVYEHMENGDLFSSLYNNRGIAADGRSQPLDWTSRLKIAIGVAKALCHLHHECMPPLVHRNVEASSILIDESYDGHLGRVFEVCKEKESRMQKESRKQSVISKLFFPSKGSERSTSSDSSNATCAYDVYCFGKVLLQLVTGIPILSDLSNTMAPNSMNYILPYITTYDEELIVNIMDPCLTMNEHLLCGIWGVAVIAKACLCPEPSKRPLMKNILKVLEGFDLADLSTHAGSLTEVTLESQLGVSEARGSALFTDMWTAIWSGQFSPPSGIWDVPSLRTFSFAQLKAATENFSRDGLIGHGAFGGLYKGRLSKSASNSDRQSLIAVKRWRPEGFLALDEWQTELNILGSLSHPNLIKLHGHCNEDKELLLVYEYMPKGSLSNHLFGRSSTIQPLSWYTRLNILIGAARGLAYLHTFKRPIIYKNFKTTSILLDSFYKPKLSGFGLARMGPLGNDSHVSTRVIGAFGYAAPEHIATGHVYMKSDVYNFGVVLVEVLTGIRVLDTSVVDWMKPRLSDQRPIKNIMDPRLEGKYSVGGAIRMAQLALTCLSSHPNDRPSMKQVMETLLGV